jgi:hypothetical protein
LPATDGGCADDTLGVAADVALEAGIGAFEGPTGTKEGIATTGLLPFVPEDGPA